MLTEHLNDGLRDADSAPASLGLGRAEDQSPVERSTKVTRMRTVSASRSTSVRRSALTSPHRRLTKVVRSTRARKRRS
ncbi:hypothetical protein Aros01_02231 [Streptosporangium roseum]